MKRFTIPRRLAGLILGLCISLGSIAQVDNLPDMGSPSDAILSLRLEAQIGRQVYYNLLETGTVITDPELQEYIQDIGMRLVAHADIAKEQSFQFFLIDSPVINAFALPGGYIGVHTGLLQATVNEDELAGVLAHEISHVTQRHISRAVLDNQRASTLSIATMLGAILVGVATGADATAIQGVVGAAQSLSIERQISFTRSNEREADRVGVNVMSQAEFNPLAMADFFETIGRKTGSLEYKAPEFLMTHPVSAERMADARARAIDLAKPDYRRSMEWSLARGRARVATSSRPEKALEYFASVGEDADDTSQILENQYGTAVALMRLNRHKEAEALFAKLLKQHEGLIPLHSGLAEAQAAQGNDKESLATFAKAALLFPRNVPLTVRYAEALLRFDQPAKAHEILLDLLNQVPPTLEQIRLIAIAANSQGDAANAHYYMAEYHAMSGSLRLAIDQLVLALGTPDIDSVNKARFTARLEQFQEYLPSINEKRRSQRRQRDEGR